MTAFLCIYQQVTKVCQRGSLNEIYLLTTDHLLQLYTFVHEKCVISAQSWDTNWTTKMATFSIYPKTATSTGKTVSGYLEYDGRIVKVDNLDAVKRFIAEVEEK